MAEVARVTDSWHSILAAKVVAKMVATMAAVVMNRAPSGDGMDYRFDSSMTR